MTEYEPSEMAFDGDEKLLNKLKFQKWKAETNPELLEPKTPLSEIIPAIHILSMQDYINKRRKK